MTAKSLASPHYPPTNDKSFHTVGSILPTHYWWSNRTLGLGRQFSWLRHNAMPVTHLGAYRYSRKLLLCHVANICKQKAQCRVAHPATQENGVGWACGSRGALFRTLSSWGAACQDLWTGMLRHAFCPAFVSIHSLQKVCDVVSEGAVLIVGLSTARPSIKSSARMVHPTCGC